MPVKIATVGMLSNIFCSFVLMGPMKHSGLALAYAIASWINFSLLFFFLRKKLGHVDARKILGSFFKTLALLSCDGPGRLGSAAEVKSGKQSGNSPEKAAYLTGTVLLMLLVFI